MLSVPVNAKSAVVAVVLLDGCDVIVVDENDKVVTNTVYYDAAEYARQIGMLPPVDSAADRAMLAAFNGVTKLRRRP